MMKLQFRDVQLDLSSRTHIMAILNVTPDSFSDGGSFTTEDAIIRQAERMISAGADIIDIGGESTRPFAAPVDAKAEKARVIPAIEAIRRRFSIPISIDTTKAAVASEALAAGADIINDVSAFQFDPLLAQVAAETGVPIIIMHMQGNPRDMQVAPKYDDVIRETKNFLAERIDWLVAQGIDRDKIIIDPGIGFGKTVAHNLSILNHLESYYELGCPLLVGHSRKSFIGKILDREVNGREVGTAAISALCAYKGAAILRVHEVEANVQAARLGDAIRQSA